MSTSQSIVLPAPPWYCFDCYTDLSNYPIWEPCTAGVTHMEVLPQGNSRRVAFEVERKLFGVPFYKLSYSLRSEVHALGNDSFFIKFDDVKGDLRYVLTIVEFRPQGTSSTKMTYKSVIGDPYRFKRTLMTLFGPSELERHLGAFKRFVAERVVETSPTLGQVNHGQQLA